MTKLRLLKTFNIDWYYSRHKQKLKLLICEQLFMSLCPPVHPCFCKFRTSYVVLRGLDLEGLYGVPNFELLTFQLEFFNSEVQNQYQPVSKSTHSNERTNIWHAMVLSVQVFGMAIQNINAGTTAHKK